MTVSTKWVLQLAWIISGGQTGSDVGSLCGARDAGVPTGGWAPKRWLTEVEDAAQWPFIEATLRGFGLRECQEGNTRAERYRARTRANVADCDAVLIVGYRSAGSILTEKIAGELGKPCLWLLWHADGVQIRDEDIEQLDAWMREHNPETLMVAGNRQTKNPGVAVVVRVLVRDMVRRLAADMEGG